MTEVEACFGNIIGTHKGTTSDSGLYITDLEALSTVDGLVGEDNAEIETILDDALRIGILTLNSDLTQRISKIAKPKATFRSKVGSSTYIKTASGAGEKGVKIFCNPVKHAELHIYSIGYIGREVKDVTLTIKSNTGEEETEDIPAQNKKLVKKSVDYSFPIREDMTDNVIFEVTHEEENYVINRVQCSGCRKFYYNEDYPKYPYGGYAMIGGTSGDNNMNGIVLGIELRCRVDKLICDGSIDFTTNAMAQSYAQAIQMKAGSVVLWKIIRSSKLNRVLMQDIENFREAASYYERRYRDIVRDIGKTIPIDGCFCEKGFTDSWVGRNR